MVGSSVLGKTSDHRPQLAVIELALVSVKKAVLAAYVAGNDGFASYKDCYVQARDGVREAVGCYVSICGRWSIQSNNRISPAKIKKGDIRLWLQVGADGGGGGRASTLDHGVPYKGVIISVVHSSSRQGSLKRI